MEPGRTNLRLRCLGSHRYITQRSDPELNGVEVQVFGIRKSPATRSALRFFAERRVKTHFVDLMERPPSQRELPRRAAAPPDAAGPLPAAGHRRRGRSGLAGLGRQVRRADGILRSPLRT